MNRFKPYAPLLLILALAAVLRLYRLDEIDVRFDEASAPQLALSILNGNFLRVAPFSGSVANHPPLYLYLLAVPYLFTRSFLAVAAFRILLDVAAVGLTWLLGARFFNARVALVAALLFAVAPWAIQLTRKLGIVTPPLFTLVWFWGACLLLVRKDARGWLWLGLGLALCVGTHFTSIYLVPPTVLVVLLARRAFNWQFALAGLAPIVALAALYLGHDAGQGFANVRALAGAGAAAGAWSWAAVALALWGSGGAHLGDLSGAAFAVWQAQLPAWGAAIDLFQMGLVLVSLAVLVLRVSKREQPNAPLLAVLLVWQLAPVVLQLRSARPLQMHYFMPLWPGAWLAVALAADWLLSANRTRVARVCVALSLVSIVAWQILTTLQFGAFVSQNDTAQGGYGEPVRTALAATDLARGAVRGGRARDVIVVAPGGNPAVDEPATVLDVLLADTPRRFVRAEDALILRGEPTQYVFAPGTAMALQRLRAFGVLSTTISGGRSASGAADVTYAILDLPSVLTSTVPNARWENGARLIGVHTTQHGGRLAVHVLLGVEAQATVDQHWFVRVQNAAGAQLGARDVGGVHPSNWRVGDVLVLYIEVPIDTAQGRPAALRIGSYAYPAVKQTPILDASGNPADDGVTVMLNP